MDSNVPIAANGRDTHANLHCQLACIEFLQKASSAKSRTRVCLDSGGLIFAEYKRYLKFRGQPGTGDMFFKFLHDQMHSEAKVLLVDISPNKDGTRGFDELPENTIDKSDRKFVAVALNADANIVNATDSDWHIKADDLAELGVTVEELCFDHVS